MKKVHRDDLFRLLLREFNKTEGKHLDKEELSLFGWEMKIMIYSRGEMQGDKRCKGQDNSLLIIGIILEPGELDYLMIKLNRDFSLFIFYNSLKIRTINNFTIDA